MILSFNNDPKIKESLIARMQKHIEADELLQKATGRDGKGCTVWCALNNGDIQYGYSHSAFPRVLGLPEWLAHLQDIIFEGLSIDDAKQFSSDWPKAIPVGKNLEPVKWKFCAFLMEQNIERVLLLNISEDLKKQVVAAINGVLSLHQSAIETGEWDESAAESAGSAAGSAAWSARSAAGSAAWSARSAAESAAWSVESAAWSARSAAAWSARSAAWSARSAAESAAWSVRSAVESAAWSAAWSVRSAAESAAWSARSAAESAAESAMSARSVCNSYAEKLLALLSES